jgi:transcriptional antiterminator NusG
VAEELKWYVVHTYSGFENKAREALLERIQRYAMQDRFGDVLIPAEEVVELVEGKRRVSKRKYFPGYILVKMLLCEETWHLVKNTPKITGFVGGITNPPSISEEEALRLTQMIEAVSLPKPKEQLNRGEAVRVVDGPFVGFNGLVDESKPEKGKVRVLVSIFGRQTPVELDFVQVEKI